MGLAYLLFFLPAFALSSKDSVAIVPAEDLKVCEYFDARIIRLGEIVNKELLPDVDIGSDLYLTLEESKLCDTVGYVAIPECVANNEGDECVARKTSEMIRKSLRAAMKAEMIKDLPSGDKFFATCKHIGYKNVLKTFNSARTLMSPECGLPGQKGGRNKRNADLLPALLLGGAYDPSSIWFQYFLCKDIDLYCYFFTQGWTQGQYGQYYLYDNLLDDQNGLFKGSTDSGNLATIALLGGLGGGLGQPSGHYPTYGAPAAASVHGKKRRQAVDDEDDVVDRKRRSDDDDDQVKDRRRRTVDDEEKEIRKRRNIDDKEEDSKVTDRKRRSTVVDCKRTPSHPDCPVRKRRTATGNICNENNPNDQNCKRRKRSKDCADDESCDRKRREACEACEANPDSTDCHKC